MPFVGRTFTGNVTTRRFVMNACLCMAFVTASSGVSASADPATPRNPDVFADAIQYEYKNVLMTHLMMKDLAESASGPVQKFWQAYYDLEAFNLTMYVPLAPQFAVNPEPTAFTRFRAWVSALAGRLFTGLTIRSINSLANGYIVELRRLRQAAPPKYDLFFDYVVAQEQLQIEFLPDGMNGDYDAAYDKVQQFLSAYSATAATIMETLGNGQPGPADPASLDSSPADRGGNWPEIPDQLLACTAAADCDRVFVDCGGCGCGMAVNRNHVDHVRQIATTHCEGYDGPLCEAMCQPEIIECVSNRCRSTPAQPGAGPN